jgi:hypothetical protein
VRRASELAAVHIDTVARKTAPFPDDVIAKLNQAAS